MTTLQLSANIPADITHAAELLRAGELVAMPTETVYGLAADGLNPLAVEKIFSAKGRPQDNPLILHINQIEQALPLVREFPPAARRLAEAFWPGPLTLVLPRAACVPAVVAAGLDTVALRLPSHPAARALLQASGMPLAAPSANRSGSPSPTRARHVLDDLEGRIAAVLDGGSCGVGVESTVLSLAGEPPVLLRPGGISPAQLAEALGREVMISPAVTRQLAQGERAASPGMKYRHYAPAAALTLIQGSLERFLACAAEQQPDGLLCFDEDLAALEAEGWHCLSYGGKDAPQAQAQRLFAALREIDARGFRRVLVRAPSREGVGLAVYNRLLRAASFNEQ